PRSGNQERNAQRTPRSPREALALEIQGWEAAPSRPPNWEAPESPKTCQSRLTLGVPCARGPEGWAIGGYDPSFFLPSPLWLTVTVASNRRVVMLPHLSE